ncbi:MAG: TonB-dependent receptor [Pseudomonadota bacterium]
MQGPIPFGIGLLTLLLAMAGGWPVLAFGAAAQPVLEEVEVIAPRSVAAVLPTSASALALDAEVLERVAATHVHEVALRVPGVWISRGSGQEHLTAIRSPVLTGPGACGSFQLLEDGIPVRPNGFCNVNNLFELNTEQAQRLEFVRGPASASFGGNAQRGVINRVSALDPPQELRLEGGPEGFYRAGLTGTAALGEQQFSFALHSEHSGGYRDATGYGQQKANLTHRTEVAGWRVLTTFAGTLLNQETGGFVSGFEVYEDDDLRSTNPNPEAYRDAWALRLTSHWQKGDWIISPYLRRSDMAFLQHFLPGQPLEENDHTSGGVILRRAFAGGQRFTGQAGLQLEWFDSALREFQDGPTIGSAFLVATRPPGLHYDYTVEGLTAAAFYDVDWALSDDGALRIEHSLRLEQLRYDYDNRTLVGNTRDDGTPCGFGGCRYSRPPSGTDRFDDIAGRLGLVRDVGAGALYAQLGRGFRPPQATELYRLQNGQTLADLNSETVDALELGFRSEGLAVALFAQRSRDLIFRDADGFNVTGGRTRAEGIEFFWQHSVGRHGFDIATTYARHRYDFSTPLAGGESISSGDAVDTAPRWQGSARWRFAPLPTVLLEAEIVGLGSYQLNASNTARYDGHWLGNLRARWQVSERLSATLRLNNVTDAQYADRADFAFGSYRYFPGLPRQVYLGMSLRL